MDRRRSLLSASNVDIDINNYLTIEALEDGLTASLSTNDCKYCIDGDGNWKLLTAGTATEVINTGHTLSFKSNLIPNSSNGIGTFTVNKNFNVVGNVMSMLFGDNGKNNYSLSGKSYAFYKLFENCTTLRSIHRGVLPANVLSNYCYANMFSNCINLIKAPDLSASTLAPYCCSYMFYGCTSLTSTPNTMNWGKCEDSCCTNMFENCTNLTTITSLGSSYLAPYCYAYMFKGCTALTSLPSLSTYTLADYCYHYMFSDCTSLLTIPASKLPATMLAKGCYSGMFSGCSNLTTAPALPATTLTEECYYRMFMGCTSLTTAPVLPALTLGWSCFDCYNSMFSGCTKLNYIKAMFTSQPGSQNTNQWLYGVASVGTFVKNVNATWELVGESGIPSGWTVQTAQN